MVVKGRSNVAQGCRTRLDLDQGDVVGCFFWHGFAHDASRSSCNGLCDEVMTVCDRSRHRHKQTQCLDLSRVHGDVFHSSVCGTSDFEDACVVEKVRKQFHERRS